MDVCQCAEDAVVVIYLQGFEYGLVLEINDLVLLW